MNRPSPRGQFLTTVVVALLLTGAFTWPCPWPPPDALASRGFDAHGMLWMGSHMARHFSETGLWSGISGLPANEPLQGNDGWLYLFAAWLLPGLDSVRVFHLWAWLGCAATFVAAERLAHSFGARWPWSMAAGLVFSANGVAATAILEGRMYQVAWWPLPLFLLFLKRNLEDPRSGWSALVTGLLWLCCLLTSVYAAILALFLAFWWWMWQPRRISGLCHLVPALLPALPGGILFTVVFLQTPRLGDWVRPTPVIYLSATLDGLLGWSPDVAEIRGFTTCTLGFAALALALASVRFVARRTWLPLLSCASVALLLSLGPVTGWSASSSTVIPTPFGWLGELLPFLSFFRFPTRFLLLTWLCLGILASLTLSQAAGRWLRGVLSAGLIVDALFWAMPIGYPRTMPIAGNPVYCSLPPGTQVLDLMPEPSGRVDLQILLVIRQVCGAQRTMGFLTSDYCLAPLTQESKAFEIRRQLLRALLEKDDRRVEEVLARQGARAIVLHGDLFSPTDRVYLETRLDRLFPGAVNGLGGGERLRLYLDRP